MRLPPYLVFLLITPTSKTPEGSAWPWVPWGWGRRKHRPGLGLNHTKPGPLCARVMEPPGGESSEGVSDTRGHRDSRPQRQRVEKRRPRRRWAWAGLAAGSHADKGGSYTGVQTGMGADGASMSTETLPWQHQPQRGQRSSRVQNHDPGPPHLGTGLRGASPR